MSRLAVLALAALLILPSSAATAATKDDAAPRNQTIHKKHPASRHWHGYGFLPGYRPPEVIERERARRYYESGPHWYGPAWPGFYRGRWNGGGFGPCYVSTPIGYMWTCGR
jgi:hypothetical protein